MFLRLLTFPSTSPSLPPSISMSIFLIFLPRDSLLLSSPGLGSGSSVSFPSLLPFLLLLHLLLWLFFPYHFPPLSLLSFSIFFFFFLFSQMSLTVFNFLMQEFEHLHCFVISLCLSFSSSFFYSVFFLYRSPSQPSLSLHFLLVSFMMSRGVQLSNVRVECLHQFIISLFLSFSIFIFFFLSFSFSILPHHHFFFLSFLFDVSRCSTFLMQELRVEYFHHVIISLHLSFSSSIYFYPFRSPSFPHHHFFHHYFFSLFSSLTSPCVQLPHARVDE